MSMEQAFQTFIEESHELLQEMEDSLLGLEQSENQGDAVDSVFRAIHTIKGSSGLFGLYSIVGFTHLVESLLDQVRAGDTDLNEKLVSLMLDCKDYVERQIDSIDNGETRLTLEDRKLETSLVTRLRDFLDPPEIADTYIADLSKENSNKNIISQSKESENNAVDVLNSSGVESQNWHISVHFYEDVLRNGMDPLSFIRYLKTIGTIENIVTLFDCMPYTIVMDPESCYLGFEINFNSDVDKATIEEAFEFVKEDCQLRIIPPHARIEEYIEIIEALSNEELKLGEILVHCGTLTERELDQVLSIQKNSEADNESRPLLGQLLVEDGLADPQVVKAALEKQCQIKTGKEIRSQSVRVDAGKLDTLINLIGELVIAGASIESEIRSACIDSLNEAALPMVRLIEEVRDSALNLRMVQIGDTFNRFQRVVRDVSKDLGKTIELNISGAETELDKSVIEKITDPLTHLVRNAIDHGIESPEKRAETGKPPVGQLTLNAYHDSGAIVIEVADDGGGLNSELILAKAYEKGLVADNVELSDKEIYQLIFEAGFSTASKVSNISGRGVGMDVVRRNIEALRGSIEIDSELGQGTMIRIRLPLTLAIIDGFMMGVGDAAYVVPLDCVEECIELTSNEHFNGQDRNFINLRGEALPFIRLRELFRETGKHEKRENIVVVRYGSQKAGFVVDRLMGEFQTVIKPLGTVFQNLKGISGSTILGSGEVALILDAPALIQMAEKQDSAMVDRFRASMH